MSVNNKISNIIQSSESDIHKISQLQQLINVNNLNEVVVDQSNEYKLVISLIKAETLLGASDDYIGIEELFKSIQTSKYFLKNSSIDQGSYLQVFIRVKFNDLFSDYQSLIKSNDYKIIELINKKLLLINNIPKRFSNLIDFLNFKIVELLIISDYDFRKANLVNYMNENLKYEGMNKTTKEIFKLVVNKRIISIDLYKEFLNKIEYNLIIKKLYHDILISNLLENNIYNLSNYYKSIRIGKVNKILRIDSDVNIEDIIIGMIMDNKLPINSKIDQINNLLIFGNNNLNIEFNDLNSHIKEVGELINEINLKFIAGR